MRDRPPYLRAWAASRAPSSSHTAERARGFADWAVTRGARARAATDRDASDLVINATPLGLQEKDPLPIEPNALRGVRAALDMVYAPGETRWVRALRAAGVTAHDGREMLVQQGVAAFTRFFPDRQGPIEVMRAAVCRALRA